MGLLTVAVMLLVTEGYGYFTHNAAQTQREKTTQRSEEHGAASGRNQSGGGFQPPRAAAVVRRLEAAATLVAASLRSAATKVTNHKGHEVHEDETRSALCPLWLGGPSESHGVFVLPIGLRKTSEGHAEALRPRGGLRPQPSRLTAVPNGPRVQGMVAPRFHVA